MDLAIEFARRGPWITHFVIDGVPTGGDYQVASDRRVQQFLERFPKVRNILELGSLEGGHTFLIARTTEWAIAKVHLADSSFLGRATEA